MMDNARIGKLVQRYGVAIAATGWLRNGPWHGLFERTFKIPRGHQIARAIGPRGMGVTPNFIVPIGDPSVGIESSAHLRHHRGTIRFPGMLLLTHPMYAYRPVGKCPRNQGRISRNIVGSVVPIAAGSFCVDAAHAFFW